MAELAGLRVLLVEDEGGVALLLEGMLEDLGCEIVASVARLSHAFEAARTLSFDLAVLDVNVAGETSFDLARELVASGAPFVFSTGYGLAGLPDDLADQPVLSKPFTLVDLGAKLEQLTGGER
jgi:CheY-like chemotaxis protein